MTVRASYDDGRNWPVAKLVEEGHAGYSDLAVTVDKTILCLYEDNLGWPQEKLDAWYDSFSYVRKRRPYNERGSVARFNLEWLTTGNERLAFQHQPQRGWFGLDEMDVLLRKLVQGPWVHYRLW